MPESNFHHFKVDHVALRYSSFAPRLFNFCLAQGMRPDSIMPSRAFCSDENQGYPIILIAKHFGTFPFNHGRVGGIVATDRHAPHSDHGKDVVIIQASHVGYDPATERFGVYRRLQTEGVEMSTDCGAICGVLHWFENEYNFACHQILLERDGDRRLLVIDNQLLNDEREEGLFLKFERLTAGKKVVKSFSTAKSFVASERLVRQYGDAWPEHKTAIGRKLTADAFYYRRKSDAALASGLLIRNLLKAMPEIICSQFPALSAAKINTQMEFDRTFRTIVKEEAYRGKKVVFISGIHIDISPQAGTLFPLTKFVPWAAYIQHEDGEGYTLEQDELYAALQQQSAENPYKIDLTEAIHKMEQEPGVLLHSDAS